MKTRPEHAAREELKRCSRCVLPETCPRMEQQPNGPLVREDLAVFIECLWGEGE